MTEKRFNVFDVDGTVFLEDHKEGSYHIGEKENVDIPCLNDIADRLNTYADENEQLKSELGILNILYKAKCKTEEQLIEMGKEVEKENEQLKQQIKDLYKFVKYDVDNEIDVYPKSILEHLVNILKIIGDVE